MVFKRPSRSLEGEKGEFNSHRKTKIFAYRMARRLLRKGNRKIRSGTGGDSGMMEMQMAFAGNSDSEDEDTKVARKIAREEQNREWRKKREMARWESCGLEPPPSPKTAREQHRSSARQLEKQLFHLLLCSTCHAQLMPQAWQCKQGHFTCGLCFDQKNMGRDVDESDDEEEERRDVVGALQRSLSSMLSLQSRDTRDTSLASVNTAASVVTVAGLREELATLAEEDEEEFEHKSFSKYRIDEIDFFLDTIEVRGDVIACYADYNNEGKSIFYDPDIEALQKENEGKEDKKASEEDFLYKDERSSVKHAFMKRLEKEGAIASLRRTLVDIVETAEEDTSPTWAKYKLDELDFFLGGTDVRKDAIGYYPDYNNEFKSIFATSGLGSDNESGIESVSTSDNSSRSESWEGAGGPRVTRCAECQQFIYKRNLQVERIARIFFDV